MKKTMTSTRDPYAKTWELECSRRRTHRGHRGGTQARDRRLIGTRRGKRAGKQVRQREEWKRELEEVAAGQRDMVIVRDTATGHLSTHDPEREVTPVPDDSDAWTSDSRDSGYEHRLERVRSKWRRRAADVSVDYWTAGRPSTDFTVYFDKSERGSAYSVVNGRRR